MGAREVTPAFRKCQVCAQASSTKRTLATVMAPFVVCIVVVRSVVTSKARLQCFALPQSPASFVLSSFTRTLRLNCNFFVELNCTQEAKSSAGHWFV